ncbi:hypothetical protein E2562_024524 [Oryza meyeriana var. granulata]|uniref:Uncharacterized protein n=1 Tax=Oryza meyeriana var. granulata TaxID=110450 RepID=A0A6G1BNN3_9ORYZ|nr:hypothetical protein E2562_024524 [Oryza meyeriana var. granulata]
MEVRGAEIRGRAEVRGAEIRGRAAAARRSGRMGVGKEMRASTPELPQGGPVRRWRARGGGGGWRAAAVRRARGGGGGWRAAAARRAGEGSGGAWGVQADGGQRH